MGWEISQQITMADAAEEAKQKEALNGQLKEYIAEWRKTREKEEEELKKLKEKQAKRKEIRAEQEKKLNQQKKEEEEKLRKEENEKKAKEAEEKKKRLEEAEAKRQEMLEAQKADKAGAGGGQKAAGGGDARREMTKTKEQLEEEKKIALSIRIKPLALEEMDTDDLKAKANELFNIVIQLETDKYDYEQKKVQQERDLMELKERQKAQLRQKALKKGLDPEALVGKYPPMIRMYSKYERRTDTRTYEDRKKLYEGGWEVIRAESLDAIWKEKFEEWSKRPSKKLPKWFGERPGKKAGDAPTPEGEEDGGEEAAAEEEYASLLESPIYSNIPGWQLWQVYPCPWLATVSLTSDLSSGLLPSPTKSSPSLTPTNVARLCIFNAGGFRAVTNLISTLLVWKQWLRWNC